MDELRISILREALSNGGIYYISKDKRKALKAERKLILTRGIIAELVGVDCLKKIGNSERYSITNKGERAIEKGTVEVSNKENISTYNIGGNAIVGSAINESLINQSSDKLRSNSRIEKTTTNTAQKNPPKKVNAETVYWVAAIIVGIFSIIGYLNDWFGIFDS